MRKAIIALSFLAFMGLILAQPVMMGWDWTEYFYPALRLLLDGESPYQPLPYTTPGDLVPHRVYHPPWLLALLAPLALLPVHTGEFAILALSYAAVCATVAILRTDRLGSFLLLSNPLVIQGCLTGNVDSFVALGLVISPRLGIFLLSLKPQLGWGAIVYLVWIAFRAQGFQKVIALVWPMVAVVALSFFPPFGFWPIKMLEATEQTANASLPFVMGLILGLALLIWGMSRKDLRAAFAGGFIAAPYHAAHSWYLLLLVLRSAKAQFVMWVLSWAVVVWWRATG